MPTLAQLFSAPGVPNPHVFVPFTAFLRIDPLPVRGKRSEKTFHMQKMAAFLEGELDTLCKTGTGTDQAETEFDYSKPIAFTPAFGNKPARLTVHGNACRRDSFTKTPVGEQSYNDDGVQNVGNGTGNASNRTPDPELDALCKSLKEAIETASGSLNLTVYRLELAGYIYGVGGTSFPL